MSNITKQDLVAQAARTTGMPQAQTRHVFEELLKLVGERLEAGDSLELRGFGTFSSKWRKPRPARNPRTGEIVPLGSRRVALFKFSSEIAPVNVSVSQAALAQMA